MLVFLSPEWLAALDRAASADERLREATSDLDLVVEQHVDAPVDVGSAPMVAHGVAATGPAAGQGDGDGDGGWTYHVVLRRGSVRVHPGPAEAPTVRFSQDLATARGIAAGTESAQRAFMTGRLRVGGDLRALLEGQEALGALVDVFATVRAASDQSGPAAAATAPAPGAAHVPGAADTDPSRVARAVQAIDAAPAADASGAPDRASAADGGSGPRPAAPDGSARPAGSEGSRA